LDILYQGVARGIGHVGQLNTPSQYVNNTDLHGRV